MPEIRTLKLPDLGEGLIEAQINAVLAPVGTTVQRLAPVLEVETDKSVVEVTSPWTGTVIEVLVEVGDWVDVGGPLARIAEEGNT